MMKNKKQKLSSGIILLLVGCALLGFLASRIFAFSYYTSPFVGFGFLLQTALSLIFAFYLSVAVHEGGHLLAGLRSGYGFSSYRIASYMWVKQDGKIRFRRFSLAGTGGQCLMTPPKVEEGKIPVTFYNLGGILANLLLSLVSFALYFIFADFPIMASLMLWVFLLSSYFALSNGIPIESGGIANDGQNALFLANDPDASEAFYKALLINAAQTEGKRISDMPDEWFTLREGADMQNVHCASMAVFATNRTLDRGDTLAAEQEISTLLGSGYNLIGLYRNLLTCDLICCRLINDPSADVSHLITPELGKFMQAMKTYPSIIRTQYILALLSEKNENRAEKILSDFHIKTKKYPYRQEIDSELSLMTKALEKSKNGI